MELVATLKQGDVLANFNKSLSVKFNQPASKDYLITIEPLDSDKHLSLQERKVIFMWCGEWAKQRGTSQAECYDEIKCRFMFPQVKDKKKHQAVKQLITDIWNQVTPEIRYQATGGHIRSEWLNHEEFHTALTQFEIWARTEAGLVLTEPDKYRQAREMAIASGKLTAVKNTGGK